MATVSSSGMALIWSIDDAALDSNQVSPVLIYQVQDGTVGIKYQCVSFYRSILPGDTKLLCAFGRYKVLSLISCM